MPKPSPRVTESTRRDWAQAIRPGLHWLLLPAGVLLALAFPNDVLPGAAGDRPAWWVAWLTLIPLAWAIQTLSGARARIGLGLFGAGFFLVNLWWLTLFGYLPWALLSLLLALTVPLAGWLAERMDPSRRLLPLTFALAWVGVEWLRGRGIFGFPWSELGASQVDSAFAQIAAVGGVPLIGFFLLWIVGAMVQRAREGRAAPRWPLPAAALLFGMVLGLGHGQVLHSVTRWQHGPTQRIVVVQPNVLRGLMASDLQIDPGETEINRRLAVTLRLSYQGAAPTAPHADPQLIVWPESALRSPPWQLELCTLCRITRSFLLLGAPGYIDTSSLNDGLANSAYLFTPDGVQVATYAKVHLVPFGEFVPMRPLVERFYTVRAHDIQPGAGHAPLTQTGLPIGVGICFESTFTDIARQYADRGTRLLVFITNDAWFHQLAGGRQHFNHARFRALETGLPVARAASTGISGFIAPDGRILGDIPTYREGALARDLPAGQPGTLYTHGGWLFGPAVLLVVLVLFVLGTLRSWRSHQPGETA